MQSKSLAFSTSLILVTLASQPYGLAADVSVGIGGARIHTSVESLYEQRWDNVVRQGIDITCGSAALATILHYQFGDKVSEKKLIHEILKEVTKEKVRRRGGFSLLDIKRVATARGYHVQGFKLSLDDLNNLDLPAIVPVTIRGFKHFAVFRGMVNDRVVLADPAFGNTALPDSDFQAAWRGVALVLTQEEKKGCLASSGLSVLPDDALVAETQSARRFVEGVAFHTIVGFDEF